MTARVPPERDEPASVVAARQLAEEARRRPAADGTRRALLAVAVRRARRRSRGTSA